jgi:hypothetical protein
LSHLSLWYCLCQINNKIGRFRAATGLATVILVPPCTEILEVLRFRSSVSASILCQTQCTQYQVSNPNASLYCYSAYQWSSQMCGSHNSQVEPLKPRPAARSDHGQLMKSDSGGKLTAYRLSNWILRVIADCGSAYATGDSDSVPPQQIPTKHTFSLHPAKIHGTNQRPSLRRPTRKVPPRIHSTFTSSNQPRKPHLGHPSRSRTQVSEANQPCSLQPATVNPRNEAAHEQHPWRDSVATSTTRGRGRRIIYPHTKKFWPAVRTAAVVVHGREAVSRCDGGGYRKGVRSTG